MKESQLIGSILVEEDGDHGPVRDENGIPQPEGANVRPSSAPPIIYGMPGDPQFREGVVPTEMPPEGLEGISPHDPRLDPAYYAYYYSQRPLDPRLPPPIMSWQWGPNGGMMVPSVPVNQMGEQNMMHSQNTRNENELVDSVASGGSSDEAPSHNNNPYTGALLNGSGRREDGWGSSGERMPSSMNSNLDSSNTENAYDESHGMMNHNVYFHNHSDNPANGHGSMGEGYVQGEWDLEGQDYSSSRGRGQGQLPLHIQHAHGMYYGGDESAAALSNQMENMNVYDPIYDQRLRLQESDEGSLYDKNARSGGSRGDKQQRDAHNSPGGQMNYPDNMRSIGMPNYGQVPPYYHRMMSNFPHPYPANGIPYNMQGGSRNGPSTVQAQQQFMRAQMPYIQNAYQDMYAQLPPGYQGAGGDQAQHHQHMMALQYQLLASQSDRNGWNGVNPAMQKRDQYQKRGMGPMMDGVDSMGGYYGNRQDGKRMGMDDKGMKGGKMRDGRIRGSNDRLDVTKQGQDKNGGPPNLMAQALLEEFRSNKSRKFGLQDIKGCVVEFSRDQYGSRFIQQKLEEATPEESEMIFQEIHPYAFRLMVDVFGNYVIQKFFEHGTKEQITILGECLQGHVLNLSLQIYGCRVIQKALEVISVDQKAVLVNELIGNVMKCVKDQNGNHVIQKCIECVPPHLIQFIVEGFTTKVYNLASHPYGCRVIQRILEHCVDPKMQTPILEELLRGTVGLVQDQYGNYVIQHVLVNGRPQHKYTIVRKLKGSYLKLSKNKFGSNVVEKCVQYSADPERDMIIAEIVGSDEDTTPLLAMMKDQYGNYVIQKVLDHVDEGRRMFIIGLIKKMIPQMRKYTYSKHIIARVEKEERKLTGPGVMASSRSESLSKS